MCEGNPIEYEERTRRFAKEQDKNVTTVNTSWGIVSASPDSHRSMRSFSMTSGLDSSMLGMLVDTANPHGNCNCLHRISASILLVFMPLAPNSEVNKRTVNPTKSFTAIKVEIGGAGLLHTY